MPVRCWRRPGAAWWSWSRVRLGRVCARVRSRAVPVRPGDLGVPPGARRRPAGGGARLPRCPRPLPLHRARVELPRGLRRLRDRDPVRPGGVHRAPLRGLPQAGGQAARVLPALPQAPQGGARAAAATRAGGARRSRAQVPRSLQIHQEPNAGGARRLSRRPAAEVGCECRVGLFGDAALAARLRHVLDRAERLPRGLLLPRGRLPVARGCADRGHGAEGGRARTRSAGHGHHGGRRAGHGPRAGGRRPSHAPSA